MCIKIQIHGQYFEEFNPCVSVEVRRDRYWVRGLSPDGTILYLAPGDVQLRLRSIA